jgi:hypothetical protein
MGFNVVDGPSRTQWFASDGTSTYYVNQIVAFSAASAAATPGAVVPLAVPAGVADLTNKQVIAGVVTGFNTRTPVYSSTSKSSTAAGVVTQANELARDWAMNGGMYAIGDPQLLVQVALINDWTLIRGPVYNAAIGTAPTVLTSTAADTTGFTTAGTTNAAEHTPVANLSMIYCRTGANAGLIRTTNDTSTTAPDATVAFPQDVAVGDTFIRVPFKHGLSKIYVAGPGLYVDNSQTPATHHFTAIVEAFDLSTAGRESVTFRFTPDMFSFLRYTE